MVLICFCTILLHFYNPFENGTEIATPRLARWLDAVALGSSTGSGVLFSLRPALVGDPHWPGDLGEARRVALGACRFAPRQVAAETAIKAGRGCSLWSHDERLAAASGRHLRAAKPRDAHTRAGAEETKDGHPPRPAPASRRPFVGS